LRSATIAESPYSFYRSSFAMSKPTAKGLSSGPRNPVVRRKIKFAEEFVDIMRSAVQIPRPFLMETVKKWDPTTVEFYNGLYMTWNGVIIDPTRSPNSPEDWLILEPQRRLDGTVVYGDNWERKIDGTFVAQSGLQITNQLCLIHNSGYHVYQDGTTIAPTGKITTGIKNSIGIIYRPGTNDLDGIQFHVLETDHAFNNQFNASIRPIKPQNPTSKNLLRFMTR
jgi:hypothetical protein